MSISLILRKVAVAATAALLLLSAIALPASAGKPASHGRGHGAEHSAKAKSVKSVKAAKALKAKKAKKAKNAKAAAAKARKAARFQANGTLLGVDGDTITVAVKGGSSKALRRSVVEFDAAGARINRDDAPATLLDLTTGDHVAVKGMKVDGVYVAKRVNAQSPEPIVEEPTEEVTETVTEGPTETTEVVEPTP